MCHKDIKPTMSKKKILRYKLAIWWSNINTIIIISWLYKKKWVAINYYT